MVDSLEVLYPSYRITGSLCWLSFVKVTMSYVLCTSRKMTKTRCSMQPRVCGSIKLVVYASSSNVQLQVMRCTFIARASYLYMRFRTQSHPPRRITFYSAIAKAKVKRLIHLSAWKVSAAIPQLIWVEP